MVFATKKRSLPFTANKKRTSSTWISFAEFEAEYLAKLEETGEQETTTVNSPQESSKLSASRRAWNLMSHFSRATNTAATTYKSRIRIKFDTARLDRMPVIEYGIVQRLASVMELRFAYHTAMYQASKRLSFGEGGIETPYIAAGTSMSNIRQNAEVLGNNSPRENPFDQKTWSEKVPHSFDSSSIFAPSSSGQCSYNSFTQSDIRNAVQTVCSDEVTDSPMNLSAIDMKGGYFVTGNSKSKLIESPEPSPQDFATQRLSSLIRSSNLSETLSSESNSNRKLLCELDRESSSSSEATRVEHGTSQSHSDEEPVEEKCPSFGKDSSTLIPKVGKSAEQTMAERILRQKKFFARKKPHSLTTARSTTT